MKTINTLKKVSLATFLTFVLSFSSVCAQNDTMYIMKSGAIVGQYNVNTEVDSVIFYKPTIEETTSGTFIDSRDGNEYNWVQIGDQVWMAENLAYLPSVNMVADGSEDAAGSYYYVYGYDGTNVAEAKATDNYATYGVLYNWTAAMNACPDGWHLPTDAEWRELTDYLGKLKATGTIKAGTGLWYGSNIGATNETGFTALPGGYRANNGAFLSIGYNGNWWSATEKAATVAWSRSMNYDHSNVYRSGDIKEAGFSVRCVRD
jgi:uncharacterized protein (TIGR02145 family)